MAGRFPVRTTYLSAFAMAGRTGPTEKAFEGNDGMATRIIYDTEFIDDGFTITPLSIAMRRDDGAELYAINDSLEAMARAADSAWLRDNVLRWLPLEVDLRADMGTGSISAHVQWDEDHPDYVYVGPIDLIANMVEDFVLERPDPQLWAYYGAFDHVFYSQLFGPMVEIPDGMPIYTLDVKQLAVSLGDPTLPQLPHEIVEKQYGGVRREHDARYDAHEEEFRLGWLLNELRKETDPYRTDVIRRH
jgi:3' exoribonuclease, RNase T-like